jgi:hypothetical protein
LELAGKVLAQNPDLDCISIRKDWYGPKKVHDPQILDHHTTLLRDTSNREAIRELYEKVSAMAKKYSITIKGLS